MTRKRGNPRSPLFSDVRELLEFVNGHRDLEAPWERRLRLALKYGTANLAIGQSFADHRHLALEYPFSNKASGKKRKHRPVIQMVPWYQRD